MRDGHDQESNQPRPDPARGTSLVERSRGSRTGLHRDGVPAPGRLRWPWRSVPRRSGGRSRWSRLRNGPATWRLLIGRTTIRTVLTVMARTGTSGAAPNGSDKTTRSKESGRYLFDWLLMDIYQRVESGDRLVVQLRSERLEVRR